MRTENTLDVLSWLYTLMSANLVLSVILHEAKNDVKEKRNFQNSLNNFTVPSRQVFSLDSWCPKSAFSLFPVIYKQPHAVSSGSARTRSHEKCASKPFILDALRAWLEEWRPLIGWEFVPLLELSDGRWRSCQEPLRLKTTLEARVQNWRETALLFLFPQTRRKNWPQWVHRHFKEKIPMANKTETLL